MIAEAEAQATIPRRQRIVARAAAQTFDKLIAAVLAKRSDLDAARSRRGRRDAIAPSRRARHRRRRDSRRRRAQLLASTGTPIDAASPALLDQSEATRPIRRSGQALRRSWRSRASAILQDLFLTAASAAKPEL